MCSLRWLESGGMSSNDTFDKGGLLDSARSGMRDPPQTLFDLVGETGAAPFR